MGIPNKDFKEILRLTFIELLESKRGVQSKLAKAIGKPASYFSEIKRGNPVNALHLKAAGIVFGPEKVVELLDIDNYSENKNILPNKEETCKITRVIVEHQDLVKRFKNPEKAKEINEDLLTLEDLDEGGVEEVHRIIKMKIELGGAAKKKQAPEKRSIRKRSNGN